MASYSRRDRNSRTRRSSRRVQDTHRVHNVDDDLLETTCIDLTREASNEDVIDLTRSSSLIDSPVVVLSISDDVGLERRRGSGRRGRRRSRTPRSRRPESNAPSEVHVLHSDESSDELPDIPFEVPEEVVSANASLLKSPEGVKISCPICLDDVKQIQRSNRQVMSTVCGHIFCDVCIKAAIASQNVCPSCRSRLTIRNIHPLFL